MGKNKSSAVLPVAIVGLLFAIVCGLSWHLYHIHLDPRVYVALITLLALWKVLEISRWMLGRDSGQMDNETEVFLCSRDNLSEECSKMVDVLESMPYTEDESVSASQMHEIVKRQLLHITDIHQRPEIFLRCGSGMVIIQRNYCSCIAIARKYIVSAMLIGSTIFDLVGKQRWTVDKIYCE